MRGGRPATPDPSRPTPASLTGGRAGTGPGDGSAGLRAGVAAVVRAPAARRLVGVRLTGQASDGVLQAALASLVLLSPERAATAGAVAAGSAVLLLPFTVVGPWAAGALDRFARRRVLVVGGAVRAVLAAGCALAVLTAPEAVVAVVALAYLSVNRLLLAALSASLPRVVAPGDLVAANAVVPTAGSAAALAGGALALAARPLVGGGDAGDARLLLACAAGCALAGVLALGLDARRLGPDGVDGVDGVDGRDAVPTGARARPGADLLAVLRHLGQRTDAARALVLVGLHRVGFGVLLVAALLLARNRLSGDLAGAAALVGWVVAASGAGFAVAAAAVPAGVRRLGRHGWAAACCALTAAAPLVVLALPRAPVLVAAAGVLGVAAQGVKVAVDTIVQTGVDDACRGRVFVLYDLVFNTALVTAAALAALVLPDDGWSPAVLGALALGWVALALGYRAATR